MALELAVLHEERLLKMLAASTMDPKNLYFWLSGYADFDIELKKDTWSNIQMVSVCDNEIFGYLSASVSQTPRYIQQLHVIHFTNEPFIFSRDLVGFIRLLLNDLNFNKVIFSVAVGNPAEELYDKAVTRMDGRIVGIFQDHYQTPDGSIHDGKWYEIIGPIYSIAGRTNG